MRQKSGDITGLPLSPHYGAGKLQWLLQQADINEAQGSRLHW